MVNGMGHDEGTEGNEGVLGSGDAPTPFDRIGDAAASAASAATGAVAGAAASARAEVEDRLGLGDEERLPWLESADDVDLDGPNDSGRFIGFVVLGLILLAGLVGGIYWATHRGGGVPDADGSLIEASKEPYKVAPSEAGGKTFEGTGDQSFKVSEGENPSSNLAGSGGAAKADGGVATSAEHGAHGMDGAAGNAGSGAGSANGTSHVAAASTGQSAGDGASAGGIGVQVGAFSTNALAEAAWSKLAGQHDALKGLNHRVVEGKADIGTVYRLQALAGDMGAANALCGRLQAGGLKCQVKR